MKLPVPLLLHLVSVRLFLPACGSQQSHTPDTDIECIAGHNCVSSCLVALGEALSAASDMQNPSLISKEGLASSTVLLAALSALPDVPPADMAAMLAAAMWPQLQPQLSICDHPLLGSSEGSMGSSEPNGRPRQSSLGSPEPSNHQKSGSMASSERGNGQQQHSLGIVQEHLKRKGMSLTERLAGMEQLSRVCAVKGLVSVLPLAALCTPLPLQQPSSGSTLEPVAESKAAQPSAGKGGEIRSFPALDERFAKREDHENPVQGPGRHTSP